jgi:hypothetical protein
MNTPKNDKIDALARERSGRYGNLVLKPLKLLLEKVLNIKKEKSDTSYVIYSQPRKKKSPIKRK